LYPQKQVYAPKILELLNRQWGDTENDGSFTWRLYGISEQTRRDLTEAQGGVCILCESRKPLVVEHCHTTGLVRGMACRSCNSRICRVKDNIEEALKKAMLLLRISEYLKETEARHAQKTLDKHSSWLAAKDHKPTAGKTPIVSKHLERTVISSLKKIDTGRWLTLADMCKLLRRCGSKEDSEMFKGVSGRRQALKWCLGRLVDNPDLLSSSENGQPCVRLRAVSRILSVSEDRLFMVLYPDFYRKQSYSVTDYFRKKPDRII